MKKIFAFTILILLNLLFYSCANVTNYEPYIISSNPQIKRIERGDHDVCLSLKLNFDSQDIMQSKLYWRCRLTFAKYRLKPRGSSQVSNEIDDKIANLVAQISLKLASDSIENLYTQNQKLDNFHHNRCLKLGYEVETDDRKKIEEYFTCRKALIDEYNLSAPYGNEEYLKYKNDSYDIGFAIDQIISRNLKKQQEAKDKYPNCVKYSLYSQNYKNCIKAIEENKNCLSKIIDKIYKKDGEEKIICQRKAYEIYGDKLLIDFDVRQKEIAKDNFIADSSNQNNLEALGLKAKMFSVESKEKASENNSLKEDQEKRKIQQQNINSRSNLYTKSELTHLRRRYISSCQKDLNNKIFEYQNELRQQCDQMLEYDEIIE
jgi:hypothetical protein